MKQLKVLLTVFVILVVVAKVCSSTYYFALSENPFLIICVGSIVYPELASGPTQIICFGSDNYFPKKLLNSS